MPSLPNVIEQPLKLLGHHQVECVIIGGAAAMLHGSACSLSDYFSREQETLPGAGETDDATRWSGRLPADNEYVIVVGGTRGNASYTLTISTK